MALEGRILTSDILADDNLDPLILKLKTLEGTVKSLTDSISKTQTEAAQLEKETVKLSTATSAGREQIVKNVKSTDELAKRMDAYQASLSETTQEIETVKQAQQQLTALQKLQAKEALAAAGSYDKLSAQLSILKIRHKQLSQEQRENTKEGKELTLNIKALNDQLKTIDETVGVHSRSVGSYKESIKAAVSELGEMPGATGRAAGGVQALGRQFLKLLGNPIVLLITAIVAGLTLLGQAFFRSEKGAQLMAKATGAMEAAMSLLVKASLSAVDALTRFANDPIEGLKRLGKVILDNVLNRLLAIPRAANEVGKALAALVKGDLEGAKNAFEDAGKQAIALATGLDPAQQKEFAAGLKEVTKEVERQTALFIKLEAAKRNIASANRELTKQAEQLQTIEETNGVIADNATKSFAEREQAAQRAREALEAKAAFEVKIARNNLSLINQEIDLRKANGENVASLLDSQLSSYQALTAAQRAYTVAQLNNDKQVGELKQDRLEKDLDILIDGFDNQKTINERLLRDERKTLLERAGIYEDTVKLANDSFAKQIETIQQFTGVQVDANDLISTSDAVLLNQKIRSLGLSEIIEGRLLEVVRERRLAVLDLVDAEKALIAERNKGSEALDPAALINYGNKAREAAKKAALAYLELAIQKDKARAEKNKKPENIYEFFGIEITDEGKRSVEDSFAFAKQQLTDFLAFRTEIANRNVANADREVQSARAALDAELQNRREGFADLVETRQKDLANAEANRQKALKQQEQAAKAERLIQTAQQATNLITGVSKLFAEKNVLAIPLAALMIGSFIGFKLAAIGATKKQYGKGDFQILGGGSHASGNDTFLGTHSSDGQPEFGEAGEARMILPKDVTSKYRTVLPTIYQALRQKDFETKFQQLGRASAGIPLIVNVGGKGVSTEKMEGSLNRVVKLLSKETTYVNGNGETVTTYKNLTQIRA